MNIDYQTPLIRNGLSDSQILTLLKEVNRLLGEVNAFSQFIPDLYFSGT